MVPYTPGLHLLATFRAHAALLTDIAGCRALFDQLTAKLQLNKLGEVYHAFPNGGFTAVVCLSESHVSIHTWPEHGMATFDVFLSNHTQDNSAKTHAFYEATLAHFDAVLVSDHTLTR